jgi:hypothetical protein
MQFAVDRAKVHMIDSGHIKATGQTPAKKGKQTQATGRFRDWRNTNAMRSQMLRSRHHRLHQHPHR